MNIENLEIEAKASIRKFAEGANPETDEPYDVVETTHIFRGAQAVEVLDQYGLTVDKALEIGAAKLNPERSN